MDKLLICETDRGRYAVRWAGIWNEKGKIQGSINHLALFIEKEDAENFVEWKEAWEQGKLLKLPCAVGDTVYRISKGAKQLIIPLQVMNFKIFNNNLVESFKMECVDEWGGGYTYHKTDIGRDVFFTHQEAEVKLAEMEGKK